MPSEPVTPARPPRRGVPIAVFVVSVVVVIALTAALVLAIDRTHRASVGAWISDFAKSPGLAGLCALIAASLALWGILRQVAVATRALAEQRESERKRAWWSTFEWVAARAVPAKREERRLPYAAVLSTLTALAESAENDVQRTAVGAITNVAAQAEADIDAAGGADVAAGADDAEWHTVAAPTQPITDPEQTLRALRAYSVATANTPATSSLVDAQLYEAAVLDAIERVAPDAMREPRREQYRPDAVLDVGREIVVVEVKSWARPSRSLPTSALLQVKHLLEVFEASRGVIVAPTPFDPVPPDISTRIRTVVWNSPDDDDALRDALGVSG